MYNLSEVQVMAKKRLAVKLERKHAMQVTRVSLNNKKLVYVILAQKKLRYPWGRSRIAYIGTTKKGMARYAQSAAAKAEEVLSLYGVREMEVRLVTCHARPNVRTWVKLERALLLSFRERFGSLPMCNTMGKRMRRLDEEDYFSHRRVANILENLG
jgi:hypothetical protein